MCSNYPIKLHISKAFDHTMYLAVTMIVLPEEKNNNTNNNNNNNNYNNNNNDNDNNLYNLYGDFSKGIQRRYTCYQIFKKI